MTKAWQLTVLILALVMPSVILLMLEFSPLRALENNFEDRLIVSFGTAADADAAIVVVEFDEATVSTLPYRSPIDREYLANLIQKISTAGARKIGVDIIFDQPTEPSKDERLRQTLKQFQEKVVIATATSGEGLNAGQIRFQREFLAGIPQASVLLAKDWQDGVVRHYWLGSSPQFAWSLAGLQPSSGTPQAQRIIYHQGDVDNEGGFNTYPANAALVLPDHWFQDKFVLIGTNLENLDQFRTPFVSTRGEAVGTIPGVRIHAHVLKQVLSGSWIWEVGSTWRVALVYISFFVGMLLVLNPFPVWLRLAMVTVVSSALLVIGWQLLLSSSVLVPVVAASLSLIVAATGTSFFRWQKDSAEKRFVRQAWSHYVSKDVVDDLINRPDRLRPGGERVDASFIFTDIEGFTALSEELPPDQLGQVVNGYLDTMIAEFHKSGATIDKIVGDAVIGIMGAPIADPEHPDNVVKLAINLAKVSNDYRLAMVEKGHAFGQTRIGINSGTAVVGNFGGDAFFDYTALGDAVNTAARLEAANKVFGGNICVSGDTARRAIHHRFRPIGQLYVAGKANPVDAFEPVINGFGSLASIEEYKDAYKALDGDPKAARKRFSELQARYPGDHLVSFYLQRLKSGTSGTRIKVEK